MRFHPDVLAAHAQFGGDLESMQKCYDWYDQRGRITTLEAELQKAREALFDKIAMSATPDDIYRHRGPYRNPAGGQQTLFTHSTEKARYRYAAEMMKARDVFRALSQDKEARDG